MEEEEALALEQGPVLDEATFQQILAAAYVLQQQNDAAPPPPTQRPSQLASPSPQTDAAQTLARIVETQEQIRQRPHDVAGAANLVAQRLLEIVHAKGVAIAIVTGDELEYRAALGTAAPLAGMRLPVGPELSSIGPQPIEGPLQHSPTDARLAPDSLSGTNASIALPLHREGKLAGLIEVRFETPNSIQEPEIRTCQLMAGLMTEAMARAAELEWRHILANERATMLEALEKIKPQLERLSLESPPEIAAPPAGNTKSATKPSLSVAHSEEHLASSESATCLQCGYQFGVGELFCGRCGARRPAADSGDLQSKWASLWQLQQAVEKVDEEDSTIGESDSGSRADQDSPFSPALEEIIAQFSDEEPLAKLQAETEPVPENNMALTVSGETAIVDQALPPALPAENPASPWGSASRAHKWLQSLEAEAPARIWAQRANIYIGLAFVLLLAVLYGWDSQPQRARSAPPHLSLFEKTLVALGLAETSPQTVYQGNPNTKVWIDQRTALYYCPGEDLYGKTSDGEYVTQRDAQLDHVDPAARRPCD